MMKSTFLAFVLIFSFSVSALASDVLIDGHFAASDRILVELHDNVNDNFISRLSARGLTPRYASYTNGRKHGFDKLKSSPGLRSLSNVRFLAVSVPKDMSIDQAIETAIRTADVKAAWPDWRVNVANYEPNDPFYDSHQSNFRQVRLPVAWDWSFGAGVTVAVIDTGYYGGLDDSANITDAYDFWDDDEDVTDFVGHGTSVANVIGEASNNSIGCASIAPASKIMPLKVFSDDPDQEGTHDSYITRAIDYAVEHGAQVINMSLGGGSYDGALGSSIRDAHEAGVVIFAASGNEGLEPVEYPAAFSEVIAVGSSKPHAIGADPKRSDFSSYGQKLDIVAPGESIVQQGIIGSEAGYYGSYGTSLACPHAAGLAALLIALAPDKPTPIEIKEIMTQTALSGLDDWDASIGWGEIDAGAAIMVYVQQLPNQPPTAAITANPTTGKAPLTVQLSGQSSYDPDHNIESWQWSLPDFSIERGANISHVFNQKGPHEVMLTVVDKFGESASATVTISVQAGSSQDDKEDDDSLCAVAIGGDSPVASAIAVMLVALLLLSLFSQKKKLRKKL